MRRYIYYLFFFNDTATTEIYPLSLHDALPIWSKFGEHIPLIRRHDVSGFVGRKPVWLVRPLDRKSTRLNSSHQIISYAVFCLKKKNKSTQKLSASHPPYYNPLLHRYICCRAYP